MWKVTIKGLMARKVRLLLTSIAVVLGVAFMSGTYVLTDTLGGVFDDLFSETTRDIDVIVRARQAFEPNAQDSGNSVANQRPPVPDDLVSTVEGADGVVAAQGSVQGDALLIGKDGEAIQTGGAPTIGVSWGSSRRFDGALRLTRGQRPTSDGEVAIDESTAEDGGFRVGSEVRIVFNETPPETFRVTGIFRFGDSGNLAGATLAAFEPETAQRVLNRVGEWDVIDVAGRPGLSQVQLRNNVAAALDDAGDGGAYEALTGQAYANEQAQDVKDGLSFFNTFLLIFALVALFVGAFIIYNTFSIIVAQRSREVALLRALGASGRQVTVSIGTEALAVGLLSSIVGLAGGVLVALGLTELFRMIGADLPSGGLRIEPRTVIVALLAGTLVTLVSAISPARRAARIPPIAALREFAIETATGRRRYVVGAGLGGVGLLLLVWGLFGSGGVEVVGLAALLVFIGVAMLSPLVARPAAHAIGWFPARYRGTSGKLARENAIRNPRRTATTASALMIGLALVSLVSIFGESAKLSFREAIDDTVVADFLLTGQNFSGFSPTASEALRDELPGAEVVEFRAGSFRLGKKTKSLLGTSPNVADAVDLKLRSDADLDAFASDGLLISDDVAEDNHWRVGQDVQLEFVQTGRQTVTIRGIYDEKRAVGSDYLLSLASYEENYLDQLDVFVGVKKPADLSLGATRRVIDRVLSDFPNIEARDQQQYKDEINKQFDQVLGLVYVLLLLAVFIALIGIVNTLALSVHERTREIGLLRAVGMSRRQVRRMIRDEAVIIAVFGSLLGLVVGIGFGRALVAALSSEGITFALPVGQLVFFVILAGLAGLGAGAWPAFRASRRDVLESINTE